MMSRPFVIMAIAFLASQLPLPKAFGFRPAHSIDVPKPFDTTGSYGHRFTNPFASSGISKVSTIMSEQEAKRFVKMWVDASKEQRNEDNSVLSPFAFHDGETLDKKTDIHRDNYPKSENDILDVFCGRDSVAVYYRTDEDLAVCQVFYFGSADKRISTVEFNYRSPLEESIPVLAQQWVAFWNEGMIDWLGGMMDTSVELTSPLFADSPATPSLKGVDTILSYFEGVLEWYPKLQLKKLDVMEGKNSVAILFEPSTGSGKECLVLSLNDIGKVTRICHHTCTK
ncbi:hypothetical protein IV203_030591 [Nitzschia inconspicua]|uniref:Uncharacterized protein n=1 Tax=Nitzschia inconspicua TaxID=303405 RepID=A0A9K3K5I2_9STRA|nr:hypothetical protein IV203_017602 [Nitzschia inconspicua]KAG7367848.1 hypothetical protein IV203_030591 [Nitzschia inconspicua]